MSGALVIKSLGTALSLSDAGELRVRNASDSHSGVVQPDGENVYIEEGILKAAAKGFEVKELTQTGNGQNTNVVTFPEKPYAIIAWEGDGGNNNTITLINFTICGKTKPISYYYGASQGILTYSNVTYSDDGTVLTLPSTGPGGAFNVSGSEYKLYYIPDISETFNQIKKEEKKNGKR